MHAFTSAALRTTLAALVVTIGLGSAAAAGPKVSTTKETLVGAFLGIPAITIAADGKQHVQFDGVGTLSDLGNALCSTTDEVFDPVLNKAYGHHVLTAENGCDEMVIWFETTSVTTTVVVDANGVPTILIKMEATWTLESGQGRYRNATGGGVLYVDAEAQPTGPDTLLGIGRWAMWGEIERPCPPRFPRHWPFGCHK